MDKKKTLTMGKKYQAIWWVMTNLSLEIKQK